MRGLRCARNILSQTVTVQKRFLVAGGANNHFWPPGSVLILATPLTAVRLEEFGSQAHTAEMPIKPREEKQSILGLNSHFPSFACLLLTKGVQPCRK
jgi:hypothetical protein